MQQTLCKSFTCIPSVNSHGNPGFQPKLMTLEALVSTSILSCLPRLTGKCAKCRGEGHCRGLSDTSGVQKRECSSPREESWQVGAVGGLAEVLERDALGGLGAQSSSASLRDLSALGWSDQECRGWGR